ncbi:MAG: YaaA family protein, partial [Saprospiraceae bacterium]
MIDFYEQLMPTLYWYWKKMLIIISPSKTMKNQLGEYQGKHTTFPFFEKDSFRLVKRLQKMKLDELQKLMMTSDKLTKEIKLMYASFPKSLSKETAHPAILSYKGDVYLGLQAESFSEDEIRFAQEHLIILSGLFGVLKPMDLISNYRLEMGSSFVVKDSTNLYSFWRQKITTSLADSLKYHQNKVLLNLASGEYFKSIDIKKFPFPIYHVEFKENKNGKLSGNSFTNKRMR